MNSKANNIQRGGQSTSEFWMTNKGLNIELPLIPMSRQGDIHWAVLNGHNLILPAFLLEIRLRKLEDNQSVLVNEHELGPFPIGVQGQRLKVPTKLYIKERTFA